MIEYTLAAGLVARMYMRGDMQREVARRHLRRRYQEGTQLAFCYYESEVAIRLQLERLLTFMEAGDEH